MLDQLLRIVETYEFEHNGWLHLEAATWRESDLELNLSVNPGDGICQRFRVRCLGVIEYHLAAAGDCGFDHWSSGHPAIDQYTEPRDQVFFGATPADPDACLGQAWLAHRSHAGNWISFDRYLNAAVPLDQLLAGGHGLFAAGPRGLISEYAQVLRQAAAVPNVLSSKGGPPHTQVELIHFGESFVVSTAFELARAPA